MKFRFLIMFLLAFTLSAFGQITRDFATVQQLRTSNYVAKKGEKVYVTSLQNLYAVDYVDNISTDDGYNVIIQGNRRWKCVSCNVPSKCINQSNITVADRFNPTYTELKNYVTSQKVPNKNGTFLNYYTKTDTTGISDGYLNYDIWYDSSRVSSIKINGVEKLTTPIWFYSGGAWVYPPNSIEIIMLANKPNGINYTVDDDVIEGQGFVTIGNVTGIFTLETTTQYYDGSIWQEYTDYFGSPFYLLTYGSGSCSSPLFSYLVVDSSIVTMKSPLAFNDLTLGKSNLSGPRSLNFASNSGTSSISQLVGTTNIGILGDRHTFSNSSVGNATGSLYMWNQYTNNSVLNVEHYGTNRANLNLYRSRGTHSSRQAVQLNDKLGSYAFTAYDGFNNAGVSSALLEGFVDGTVSNGSVPMRFSIVTGTNSSNRAERLVIKADGSVLITPITFAQLPTSGVLPGSIRVINDASTVTYRGNASGGGGNVSIVMWTGSGWIYQ